jgi:hypothetical protein
MDKGYHKIFWGLILLSFHINLGPIQIVPGFVSWIIILTGIEILQQGFESQGFNEGSRYAKILLFISIVGGLISLFGGNALNNSIIYSYLSIVVMILELLFAYKIMEGSIEALRANEMEDKALDLEDSQKLYTKLFTAATIGLTIAITFKMGFLMTIAAIFALIVRIFLMSIMNNLKKIYLPPAENEQ